MARLLVVEDEQDVLDLVVRRLAEAGHTVLGTGSGAGALAIVDRHGPPDAAILDIGVPDMDGFALLDALRSRCPGLPALFLTGFCTGEAHERAMAAGALHVPKPFSMRSLRAAVNRLLPDLPDLGEPASPPVGRA